MIVGLVGLIGSGKGTVGQMLIDAGYKQESFAGTLKDAAASIFGWPRHLLEGDTDQSRHWRELKDHWWAEKLNVENFTPRLALQLLGTEVFRDSFHPDIWILSLENKLRKTNTDTVITDVRFPNEIGLIQKNGGVIVRVKRGPNPDWMTAAYMLNTMDHDTIPTEDLVYFKHQISQVHPSEYSWVGCKVDYRIDNDGTMDDLRSKVSNLLQDLQSSNQ